MFTCDDSRGKKPVQEQRHQAAGYRGHALLAGDPEERGDPGRRSAFGLIITCPAAHGIRLFRTSEPDRSNGQQTPARVFPGKEPRELNRAKATSGMFMSIMSDKFVNQPPQLCIVTAHKGRTLMPRAGSRATRRRETSAMPTWSVGSPEVCHAVGRFVTESSLSLRAPAQ